jgi:hypothetical protein
MTCNISNTFTDVTIQLSANGKDKTIFDKKPQGNFSWRGWELQVQGGLAQLVIKDTQDDHTGIYLWQLHGRQRCYKNITLNILGELRTVEQGDGRGSRPVYGVWQRRMVTQRQEGGQRGRQRF